MEFGLSEQQRLVRELAAEVAESEFAGDAFTREGEFPWANVEVLAEQDLLGIGLPTKYGGGYTALGTLLATEAVGRVCPDTAHVLSRPSMGPPRVIAEVGSEHLKERYLPGVCAGETVMSAVISEESAGTDASAMRTSARREGDEVILNGHKMWVTKGDVADAFLAYARFPDDNIGAVVVDDDAPGLTVEPEYENMAGHTQAILRFDDCRIPESQILAHGEESFKELLIEFNVERCHNATMCVACGLNAFDRALEYVQEREQFGQPIGEFQGVEWKLADMVMRLESARLLIYRAVANARDADPSRLETSMAKVVANEAGQEVVDEALQLHGARGYAKESPLEYLYRLVRGWKIAGGTVEIQRGMIARDLKKHGLD